jgi:hypothetical protein
VREIPSCFHDVSEALNRVFNLGVCFEWHMESEIRREEVAEIVPVGLSIA